MPQNTFNNIVDKLGPRLLRFAAKQIGSIDIAKDLVQETFIVYLDKQVDIIPGKEKSFLFKVISYKILDHFKLKKHNVDYTTIHLYSTDDHREYEHKELINLALLRLKPVAKQLITLRDLEGYNYQEVADIMDISIGKVKVYLFRARKALKEEIIKIDMSYERSN
ncbi:MAG: hypothetical protein COA58_09050 [Bacteroidetes bacterium]|nr:MAG: hypothetical protein COA58_09050 [Bacteroidota bacterium]